MSQGPLCTCTFNFINVFNLTKASIMRFLLVISAFLDVMHTEQLAQKGSHFQHLVN